MAAGNSKLAVVAALAGNGLVMISKFIGFFVTGSGVMLSEGIHSLADIFNQTLLYIGIKRSSKDADEKHAYGYSAERFVWALISAVGIFFLGCGVTGYHGVHSLMEPSHESISLVWALSVLIFSLVVELWVLIVAVRQVQQSANGQPFFLYMRTEADPSVVAVVLEDAAACVGVVIALAAILLGHWTGSAYWDGIGSLFVSALLGGVAIWLIRRNQELLVGPSIPAPIRNQVQAILDANPAVEEVVDLRTRVLDSETYRIKADVRFDGAALAKKLEGKLRDEHSKIESFEDFQAFATRYADDLVDLVADEIDTIERQIREKIPKARHLDIEAD